MRLGIGEENSAPAAFMDRPAFRMRASLEPELAAARQAGSALVGMDAAVFGLCHFDNGVSDELSTVVEVFRLQALDAQIENWRRGGLLHRHDVADGLHEVAPAIGGKLDRCRISKMQGQGTLLSSAKPSPLIFFAAGLCAPCTRANVCRIVADNAPS